MSALTPLGNAGPVKGLWKRRLPRPLPLRSSLMGVYVLPHRSGMVWSIIVLMILAWSLNSGNNMGLLLGSVLAVAGVYGALMPAGKLLGLKMTSAHCASSFAGSSALLKVKFTSARHADGLMLESGSAFEPIVFNAAGDGEAVLGFPAIRRGVYAWPALNVSTRRPLGISVAWVRFWPQGEIVIWPQPEGAGPRCPGYTGQQQNARSTQRAALLQSEEWSHLREYREGDRWRDMDWKRVARTGEYWVRQYDGLMGGEVHIRWDDVESMEYEARLRRLARWVLEAEREARVSTLTLPHVTLGPGRGEGHRIACLNALARMPHHE